jgi:hypothetical protein
VAGLGEHGVPTGVQGACLGRVAGLLGLLLDVSHAREVEFCGAACRRGRGFGFQGDAGLVDREDLVSPESASSDRG